MENDLFFKGITIKNGKKYLKIEDEKELYEKLLTCKIFQNESKITKKDSIEDIIRSLFYFMSNKDFSEEYLISFNKENTNFLNIHKMIETWCFDTKEMIFLPPISILVYGFDESLKIIIEKIISVSTAEMIIMKDFPRADIEKANLLNFVEEISDNPFVRVSFL